MSAIFFPYVCLHYPQNFLHVRSPINGNSCCRYFETSIIEFTNTYGKVGRKEFFTIFHCMLCNNKNDFRRSRPIPTRLNGLESLD